MLESKRWKKLEQKVIKEFGGKVTPNSGALPGQKADGRIGFDWRLEHKGTDKDEFKVTQKLLDKLCSDCAQSGGRPLLIVTFRKAGRSVVVAPADILAGSEIDDAEPLDFPFYCDAYDVAREFTDSLGMLWYLLSSVRAKTLLRVDLGV